MAWTCLRLAPRKNMRSTRTITGNKMMMWQPKRLQMTSTAVGAMALLQRRQLALIGRHRAAATIVLRMLQAQRDCRRLMPAPARQAASMLRTAGANLSLMPSSQLKGTMDSIKRM